jgi:hypothetical protein
MRSWRPLPPLAALQGHADDIEYIVGPVDVGCAAAWLERNPRLALPRLCVVAQEPPLTDEAVEKFLAGFLQDVIDQGEPYSVLWDCRSGAFPSLDQFKTVIAWLDATPERADEPRSITWDALVQGNSILVRNPLLRATIRLMAAISRPPQPTHVGSTLESALEFAQAKCKEARTWA